MALLPEGGNWKQRGIVEICISDHEWRDSAMGAVIHIWANGAFKPALFRLIRGISELICGMDITRKLDSAVNFGGINSMFGRVNGWVMPFSEKRHCAFPLVRTVCAYDKLNEYFGKLRSSEI